MGPAKVYTETVQIDLGKGIDLLYYMKNKKIKRTKNKFMDWQFHFQEIMIRIHKNIS